MIEITINELKTKGAEGMVWEVNANVTSEYKTGCESVILNTTDVSSATPLNELTEETVKGWVETALTEAGVIELYQQPTPVSEEASEKVQNVNLPWEAN
jgi:hypothetical protein